MPHDDDFDPSLQVFEKLPLGGLDRRAMLGSLAERGSTVAREDLAAQRARLEKAGVAIAKDACVLLLGGSNGILRSVAIQLLFAEGVPVWAVHRDSEQLQIGVHHARAIMAAAEAAGVDCTFRNDDALREQTIASVVEALKGKYRCVHLIDGIASGSLRRLPEFGPGKVRDLDVAFDPVRQIPDYSRPENVRNVGLVEVPVATPIEIERTNKMMASGALLWAEALSQAGLLVRGESIVAFCDYDYEPDDPVYAKGPLAGAKNLQRQRMKEIHDRLGARTVRIGYPVMNTTAIGTIPGGCLMYAGTTEVLLQRGKYRSVPRLALETMGMFQAGFEGDALRLDVDYQDALPAFHDLKRTISTTNFRDRISHVIGHPDL